MRPPDRQRSRRPRLERAERRPDLLRVVGVLVDDAHAVGARPDEFHPALDPAERGERPRRDVRRNPEDLRHARRLPGVDGVVAAGLRQGHDPAAEIESAAPVEFPGLWDGLVVAAPVEARAGGLREKRVEERMGRLEGEVVRRAVRDEGVRGVEVEQGAIAFVRLDHAEVPGAAQHRAGAGFGAPVDARRAVDDGGLEAGDVEDVPEHRGDRGFAAGSRDGDERAPGEGGGEGLRAVEHGDAAGGRGGEIRVVRFDRRAGDDGRQAARDAGAVLRMDPRALAAQDVEHGQRATLVEEAFGPRHGGARVEQGFRERGHPDAADADEVVAFHVKRHYIASFHAFHLQRRVEASFLPAKRVQSTRKSQRPRGSECRERSSSRQRRSLTSCARRAGRPPRCCASCARP